MRKAFVSFERKSRAAVSFHERLQKSRHFHGDEEGLVKVMSEVDRDCLDRAFPLFTIHPAELLKWIKAHSPFKTRVSCLSRDT
jgi:hypothetical protein